MSTRLHCLAGAAFVACLALVGTAQGQVVAAVGDELRAATNLTVSFSNSTQRIDQLEAELVSLRKRIDKQPCAAPCAPTCCDPCCRAPGLVAGAELTLLKPYHSMGVRGLNSDVDMSFDLKATPRFWVGFAGKSGLGVRARYWNYDQTENAPGIVTGETQSVNFDTYVLDLEITDATKLGCNWQAMLSGGLRYVDFEETYLISDGTNVTNGHQFYFNGIGPTVALEARRRLFGWVGLFANARGSILVGDERERIGPNLSVLDDFESDDIKSIWETQLGFDIARQLSGTTMIAIRTAAEFQYWDSFSGEFGFDGGEAVGFGGLSVSAILSR